jgi:hypothetical protein
MHPSRVMIVNASIGYIEMFSRNGWEIVQSLQDAELIQFTGGADITPGFYGHAQHERTYPNIERDMKERLIFNLARACNIPMAGICRGGQFLNVMSGGTMWQHVDHHTGPGKHEVIDHLTKDVFYATSTHHQMMCPGKDAEIVASADMSSIREKCTVPGKTIIEMNKDHCDPEVLWYEKTKSLCFQPHPEFPGEDALAKVYLDYICRFLYLPSKFHWSEAKKESISKTGNCGYPKCNCPNVANCAAMKGQKVSA